VKQLRSTRVVTGLSSAMAELKSFHSPYRSRLLNWFQRLATLYVIKCFFITEE
jgi:hypothetical protein